MSTPDEALAAAIAPIDGHAECAPSTHAREIAAALAAEGFSIVPSDELARLRAAAQEVMAADAACARGDREADRRWDAALEALRSALEGVSR